MKSLRPDYFGRTTIFRYPAKMTALDTEIEGHGTDAPVLLALLFRR